MNKIKNLSAISLLMALAVAMVLPAAPASADVHLRVESRPDTGPIDAFVTVTDENGRAVTGLTAADFAISLDGAPLNTGVFGLPPALDGTQKKSIVFVFDAGVSVGEPIHDALASFIQHLAVGEYAAIVKIQTRASEPDLAPEVLPLTQVDGGAGTSLLIDFLSCSRAQRPGWPLRCLDARGRPVCNAPVVLPDGPKAIVMVDDGIDNSSFATQSDVVAFTNGTGIPIFTVGVGDVALYHRSTALLTLAEDTGGAYVRDEPNLALATVASLLNDAYRAGLAAGHGKRL